MEKAKVSIIIPVYNTAQFLADCIESVRTQTYPNLEILLIDDGSTDNSSAICDAFAKEDSRIVVIHKQNTGVSDTRNCGITRATGKYIAFVDSDDIISPGMIEHLLECLEDTHAEIAMCGYQRIAEQHLELNVGAEIQKGCFTTKQALQNIINTRGYRGFLCNKLFSANLLKEPEALLLDTNISVCEDLLFSVQAIDRATRIAYTSEKLYGYLVRSNSATNEISEKVLTSLTAKIMMLPIYKKYDLPDAASWLAYSIAHLMSFGNTYVVKTHYELLEKMLRLYQGDFLPQLHTKKETIIFYCTKAAPRFFSKGFGFIRKCRKC